MARPDLFLAARVDGDVRRRSVQSTAMARLDLGLGFGCRWGKVRGERGARATGNLLIHRWRPGLERVRRGRARQLGRYSHGRYSVKEMELLQKAPCLFSVFSVFISLKDSSLFYLIEASNHFQKL